MDGSHRPGESLDASQICGGFRHHNVIFWNRAPTRRMQGNGKSSREPRRDAPKGSPSRRRAKVAQASEPSGPLGCVPSKGVPRSPFS